MDTRSDGEGPEVGGVTELDGENISASPLGLFTVTSHVSHIPQGEAREWLLARAVLFCTLQCFR